MSDANDIRAKRLARLAALSGSSTPEKVIKKDPPKPVSSVPQAVSPAPQVVLPTPQTVSQTATQTMMASSDVFNLWACSEIEHVLHVTLTEDKPGLLYLPATHADLTEDNETLSAEHIERIFMEALVEHGVANPFAYLRACWTSAAQSRRLVSARDVLRARKLAFLDEILRLAPSYGLICFQIPDMFLNNTPDATVAALIANIADYTDFLMETVAKAVENDFLLDFLNIVVPRLSAVLLQIDLNDQRYGSILTIFQVLVSSKAVAAVFTDIDNFHPEGLAAPEFETKTILGPLLRLSPLQPSVSAASYAGSLEKSPGELKAITEGLQSEYNTLVSRLFNICDRIVRGSPRARRALVRYFAALANANHLRRGERADRARVAGDGIMCNVLLILVLLSQPFLDTSLQKLDKIDIDFFLKSVVLDIREETRINATIKEAAVYDATVDTDANFISECFFLTLAFLHYGIGGCYTLEDRLKAGIKQIGAQVAKLEGMAKDPRQLVMKAVIETQLERLRTERQRLKSQIDALVCFFTNAPQQENIFDFIAGACAFMVRAVDPVRAHPARRLALPFHADNLKIRDDQDRLRELAPTPWRFYPEFLIEGIVNYCAHVVKYTRNPLVGHTRLPALVEFAVVMLRCPELVGNPHLKGKLVEVLFFGALPSQDGYPGFMAAVFETNALVRAHVLYAILDFYVAVEKTGASSQFYDKFNARYHISMILEQLWKTPLYREQLREYSRADVEFFVRFVARMLNDTTYLLDEAYGDLSEIHNLQSELARRANSQSALANPPMEGTDDELNERLDSVERQSKNYVQLSNKTLELFKLFTSEVPRAFVLPEIVDRLAGMLDYNLAALVGPKCRDLKVANPEKYAFDPKQLLGHFAQVYINLSGEEEFVLAVARDGRSFARALFARAEEILARYHILPADAVTALGSFAARADAQKRADDDEELELGDVPDEFLDPLMYTLMSDPVILPGSKISIDRSTIKSHLLSDATDPFNRMPLKLEDVEDDVELRARIAAWKYEMKKDVLMER
ncbi:hypothetical protein BABINDRAFT_9297 [Babjeviella inositovora NRRL Y-12698]|uniref:RING-type E3 ubiquitin transferase n=1 Tax=Babjeviella inositovora NRRL Y-12698 TaxID=984486 RepID=A0A1E3QLE9_9ASCO|nr:uncharacterized protein BABINDRAFT_9297 [Babjeviella inositovora NRRL Y-12698]ODQ78526.1 hypothetical protein BABINDRAFT_9297 [Babjeviella inositovora NRRL Y-12698]